MLITIRCHQFYEHRLHEKIRSDLAEERGDVVEGEDAWSDWVEDTRGMKTRQGNAGVEFDEESHVQSMHGFKKWYEESKENDLARQADHQTTDGLEGHDEVEEPVPPQQWIPPANLVPLDPRPTPKRRNPCSLPLDKSPEGSVLGSCTCTVAFD